MEMEIRTQWTDKARATDKALAFGLWIQRMANRLIVGAFRYDKGRPMRKARYLTRLKAEVAAYDRTGNIEHLINAANYCFLESAAPEHQRSHFAHASRSVTRDDLGMEL
jgi:hypothetical protein